MVPAGFAHCFNGECKKADQCLRYQITRYIPTTFWAVLSVIPAQTCPEGDCPAFVSDQPVEYAYGMTHLWDNLLYVQAKALKNQLLLHYGKTHFYRLKRKERSFSPNDQQYVRNLFLRYGITKDPVYDYYETGYVWNGEKVTETETTDPQT